MWKIYSSFEKNIYRTLNTSKFALLTLSVAFLGSHAYAAIPSELKLDYAYYAPTSLVVKEQKIIRKSFTEYQNQMGI